MLGLSVLLLAAAWPTGYPEAAGLGAAGIAAVAGAVAWTLPPQRVTAERTVLPARVARGDRADAVLTLVDRKRRGARRVDLEDHVGDSVVYVTARALPTGEPNVTRYALPTRWRGRVTVGPLLAVRADPLGLARRARRCAADTSVLVRPRVHPLPLLSSGRAHHIEGPSSANADGGSQTFHTLRGYVLGDDLRRVHWRSSARTGELMVRQMVDVSMPHTTVLLDTRTTAYPEPAVSDEVDEERGEAPPPDADAALDEPFELAVEVAASAAFSALLHRFPLRVLTETGTVVADSRRGGTPDDLLDALAVLEPSDEATLAGALDELERSRAGGTLVIATGHGDLAGIAELPRMIARFERVLVVRTGRPADGDGTALPQDVHRISVDSPRALVAAWQREAIR
ncbi:DUF58 domain-containing protein [Yinghuangia seranimata]|uniref:DUF58 domain-containing protein n=1 Tax=Yinghuangia seranimata TaxID=408067 RepID=UPI00248D1519|nr:DUF58 domain-containing protein [Yinghuangia seranimata]MDI2125814.1 DUF58 domain-containing protein [Yinghuangia seranimata]